MSREISPRRPAARIPQLLVAASPRLRLRRSVGTGLFECDALHEGRHHLSFFSCRTHPARCRDLTGQAHRVTVILFSVHHYAVGLRKLKSIRRLHLPTIVLSEPRGLLLFQVVRGGNRVSIGSLALAVTSHPTDSHPRPFRSERQPTINLQQDRLTGRSPETAMSPNSVSSDRIALLSSRSPARSRRSCAPASAAPSLGARRELPCLRQNLGTAPSMPRRLPPQ
jgi:hypothetical protein